MGKPLNEQPTEFLFGDRVRPKRYPEYELGLVLKSSPDYVEVAIQGHFPNGQDLITRKYPMDDICANFVT